MRAMFAFARDADQIPTEGCSAATIMRAAQFARGLADVRAGRAPDYDGTDLDAYWAYERGRQFGCIAPLNMTLRVGSKLNGRALALFKAAISRGADPMSTRTLVAIEADLHAALKVDARNAIKIGRLLLEAQRQIFRGKWLPWLRENFALTERTAQNYMRAAKLAAKNETVSDLQLRPTALYAVAKMPPEAADAVLEAAKDRWIDRHEALEIAAAVSGADTAAAKDRPDINEILDGPPPALPQQEAAPPLPRDAALFATLAEAVRAILSLKTVSAEKLAQSGVSVDDAELAAALLGQIAEALRRKKAA